MRLASFSILVVLCCGTHFGCSKKTSTLAPVTLTPATVSPPVVVAPSPTVPVVEMVPEAPKPDRKALTNQVNDAVALLTLGTPEASERALGILKGVVNLDDSFAFAHYNTGVAHHQLNQLGAARMAYERALDADETFSSAWLAVGLLQDISGNSSRAIAKYRQGLEHDPDDIELHVALIGSLRRQKRIDDAISAAKEALKINSNSLAIYNELGLVYLAKNDLNMAGFVYLKAKGQVDGGNNNASIRCNLGRVLYLQGEVDLAEFELKEAHRLDQKYFSTLVYLSAIHFDNRAYDKALPLLEEARRQQPDHHGVAMNLGLAYRGVDRFNDAKRLYEDAIRINKVNSEPYLNLGILYGDYLKQYDDSINAFNTYISMGGGRKGDALEYVAKVEKEQKSAAKKQSQAADRKKREKEREERARLLREAEAKTKANELPNEDVPSAGTDNSDSSSQPKQETNSPWE